MLKLLHNNVFDVVADALLLTIDGQARGLRGNVAHAFQRRWPEAYEDFESQLRFPVPLGTTVRIDADTDGPWRTILFVSTLHHLETLDDGAREVIRRGLRSALDASLLQQGLQSRQIEPVPGDHEGLRRWRGLTLDLQPVPTPLIYPVVDHPEGPAVLRCVGDVEGKELKERLGILVPMTDGIPLQSKLKVHQNLHRTFRIQGDLPVGKGRVPDELKT